MTDQKIVEFPLSETRLTVRTLNCLASENIITFTQLSKKSYSSLMRVSGLGAKSIAEIVELVNSYGVRIDGQERYDKKRQGIPWVKKLIEQAVLAEREACAKVCDELQDVPATEPRHCAQDIRLRGQQ